MEVTDVKFKRPFPDATNTNPPLPELPPELILLLIETMLEIVPKRATELLLLSRNIKPMRPYGIERALYRTIVLESHTAAALFTEMLISKCRPDSFYHTTIRTICVVVPLPLTALKTIFSACPAAQSIGILACPTNNSQQADVDPLTNALASSGLQPSRLSIVSRRYHNRFRLSPFRNVTHFQFTATSLTNISFIDMRLLDPLTNLTHLSINLVCRSAAARKRLVANLILADMIRVCIVYIVGNWHDKKTFESVRKCSKDPRVVFALNVLPADMKTLPKNVLLGDMLDKDAFVQQWGRDLGKGEIDIWEKAEEIVAVQRLLQAAGRPFSDAINRSSTTS
ncbi:hypothetical protein C8J56DRAFT_1166295 [Mycena floridula]|nr:hypothetical protein C8J56DRAFT_1166295 [Mycena floridula]